MIKIKLQRIFEILPRIKGKCQHEKKCHLVCSVVFSLPLFSCRSRKELGVSVLSVLSQVFLHNVTMTSNPGIVYPLHTDRVNLHVCLRFLDT